MRKIHLFCFLVFSGLGLSILFSADVFAENSLTRDGADTCLKCHDADSDFPVMEIFKTPHATLADKRTPFAHQQCESCHGPGGEHAKRIRRGETRPPILSFKSDNNKNFQQHNQQCLSCHQSQHVNSWQHSEHQLQQLQCTSCHTIHAAKDPVLQISTQANVCFQCHQEQKADSFKFSSHPVRFNQMTCSDCHQAHSSENLHALKRSTVNDTCFECHAEKRGPFLWEHAPVTEDCSFCHNAHGSSNQFMLTRRAPLLCQQCHTQRDHPSLALTGSDFAEQRGQVFLLGNSCSNCHSKVHGSNHPSGESLSR